MKIKHLLHTFINIKLKPMKPKIALCCICAFLFFSCKKEKKSAPTQKSYPLAFNLSGFSINQVPIEKARTTSLKTHDADSIPVQSLAYLLYKANYSQLISTKRTNKGDVNYGRFTDNVPPGNYVAVFAGGSSKLQLETYTNGSTDFLGYPFPSYSLLYWDDTFLSRVPITVTDTGINMTVNMTRAIARLDVVFKDPIPAGTKKIVMIFREYSGISLYNGNGSTAFGTSTNTFNLTTADVGKINYKISVFATAGTTDLTIDYYGTDLITPLGEKKIPSVKCEVNKITTLSGNLFNPGNNEYDITINTDWNTPINVGF